MHVDVESIFEAEYEGLYRYLVRLTGDADLAADIAQECFIRLVERQPHDRQLRGWLFRVGTNLVRDDSRVRRRRMELLDESPGLAAWYEEPPDPERVFEEAEAQRMVHGALAGLNHRDRKLLLMRQAGFSHREMAEAVGTTTKSVGSMIARALRKFAQNLPKSEVDP